MFVNVKAVKNYFKATIWYWQCMPNNILDCNHSPRPCIGARLSSQIVTDLSDVQVLSISQRRLTKKKYNWNILQDNLAAMCIK